MSKPTDAAPRLLTRAEVAAIFHVSPSTVTRWAEAGKLPVTKTLGGHRRYDAATVHALAQQSSPVLPPNRDPSLANLANQEAPMVTIVIDIPAMYGDHHVLAVRRILLALPGIRSVTASSCFRTVAVDFEPDQTSAAEIKARLDEAGYLQPLPIPLESETAVTQLPENERAAAFRHTAAYKQTKHVVGFAHSVSRHLEQIRWPCPGIGRLTGPHSTSNGNQKEEASHA